MNFVVLKRYAMPAAGRVGDIGWNPADAHGCPSCPHPVQGPAVRGSPDIRINGMEALRIGDPGKHAACCGSNSWKAATGAPGVFFNDIAAHRVADTTEHCGGSGLLISGSANVIIGDFGGANPAAGGSTTSEPVPAYDQGFILKNARSGAPVANRRYRITTADGRVVEGRTNARGRTSVVDSEAEGALEIEVFPEDS